MDELFSYTCAHAHSAHYILFILLLLSGLSIPISEDLVIITAGVIASTCIPDHALSLLGWMYFGAIISSWESYWIGRILGPKAYDIPWFKWILNPKKIKKLHEYYEIFGVFIFVAVRFCPGVRLIFYASAGLGKMPFHKLVIRDAFAALFSIPIIFSIGYYFGANYETIVHNVNTYSHIALGLVITLAISFGIYKWLKIKK